MDRARAGFTGCANLPTCAASNLHHACVDLQTPDLILTTLAPPRHSPSARAIDIESSLYFLHLHATEPEVPRATLIRRDPASGAQTNIAHILPTGETVQLELLGPGYRKFLELPLPPRPQDSDTDDVLNEWQTRRMDYHRRTSPVPSMLGADLATVNTSHFFTREMRIEGANLWERMKGFRRHQKNSSVLDVPSRERTKKTRDFVFEPPWAIGRCEFKDEAGGKFLKVSSHVLTLSFAEFKIKCKHYIPDEEKSTLLSVIEFKPPSLAHRRTLSDSGGGREKYGKIKAKMGMLVVHSPGQEFLDLLVTANMVAFLQRWDTWGIEQDRWQE